MQNGIDQVADKLQPTALAQPAEARERAGFLRLALAITLLALVLRVFYFWFAQVDHPIRGDVLDYWNYGWNLIRHGTFSASPPDGARITPDSFRGPGYPLFLALWMALAGSPAGALKLAQGAQILVGCALVPLTIVMARTWLGRPAALAAGVLVALWPHLIVFSSTLLSETVFGFLLLALVLVTVSAYRRNNRAWGALAGLLAGFVYLTNPVVMLFPVVLACVLGAHKKTRAALWLLIAFTLVVAAWGIRNSALPESVDARQRASINLVQGSWPLFHAAYNDRSINETARSIVVSVEEEEQLMLSNPRAGLASMWGRFSEQPPYYLRWYLLQKPYLLWDWRVRIGWGDVYFLETRNSPFERNAVLRGMHGLFKSINPIVFGFAVLGVLFHVGVGFRRTPVSFAPLLVALFFVYITAIHTVLQAEPRYSVAYRPFEILLAVSALMLVVGRLSGLLRRVQ